MKSVWKHTLRVHEQLKPALLRSISYTPASNCIQPNGDQISRTDYYEKVQLTDKNYFTLFYDQLGEFFDEVGERYVLKDFDVVNGWFQQYQTTDIHNWHFHGNTNVACVYFLEMEKKEDSTLLYDPDTMLKYQHDVEEGDILVFPGCIPHCSPALTNSERKTIIGFNLSFKTANAAILDAK